MRGRRKFTNGDRFGKLTVVKTYDPADPARTLVRCDCGVEKSLLAGNVTHTGSCGCATIKHGMSYTKTYASWNSMLDRCLNPQSTGYEDYGGRGIRVCNRWRHFEQFHADMGDKPTDDHTIGRIDNDGHYQPGNVRWETWDQQAYNKRSTVRVPINGVEMTVPEAAEVLGIKPKAIYVRRRYQKKKAAKVKQRIKPTQEHIEKAKAEARKLFR